MLLSLGGGASLAGGEPAGIVVDDGADHALIFGMVFLRLALKEIEAHSA